jgi:hypothetical protein
VKISEPLDIDWTARLDTATGQPLDKELFILVRATGQPLDTGFGQATGHSRPSIEGGWPGRGCQHLYARGRTRLTDRFRQPVPGGGLYRPPEPVPRSQYARGQQAPGGIHLLGAAPRMGI